MDPLPNLVTNEPKPQQLELCNKYNKYPSVQDPPPTKDSPLHSQTNHAQSYSDNNNSIRALAFGILM